MSTPIICPDCKSAGPFASILDEDERVIVCFHKPHYDVTEEDIGTVLVVIPIQLRCFHERFVA